jgi:hypothetical protein
MTMIKEMNQNTRDSIAMLTQQLRDVRVRQEPATTPAPARSSFASESGKDELQVQNELLEAMKTEWSNKKHDGSQAIRDVDEKLRAIDPTGKEIPAELKFGLPPEKIGQLEQVERSAWLLHRQLKNDTKRYYTDTGHFVGLGSELFELLIGSLQPFGYNLDGFADEIDKMLKEPEIQEAFERLYNRSGMLLHLFPKQKLRHLCLICRYSIYWFTCAYSIYSSCSYVDQTDWHSNVQEAVSRHEKYSTLSKCTTATDAPRPAAYGHI